MEQLLTAPDQTVIRIRDVTKVYTMGDIAVHALRGVSLDIQHGEFVAIMGPSGSGKSTLMNIIGCLDQPTSGSYQLDGVEVADLSDDELARIRNRKLGFVFQSFNLLPRLPAVEQVELPLLYGGIRPRRERALTALRAEPSLILADEPTGALDTRTSEEIMGLLQALNRERGLTVVLVTHEEDIAQHAQRIITLRDGVISSDAPVARPRRAGVGELVP